MKVINKLVVVYLFCLISFICISKNMEVKEVKEVKGHEEVHEVLTVENTDRSYKAELKEIARLNEEMFKLCSYDNEHGEIECD